MNAFRPASRQTHQESAMRIQPHSTAATTKSSRSPHSPAMKAAAPAAARAPAKAAAPAVAAAPARATKVATQAKAAEAAAKPETYGGAGSLLDAHA